MSDLFGSLVAKRSTMTRPAGTTPQRGIVTKVVSGGVMVVLPDWDGGVYEFGPAKYTPTIGAVALDGGDPLTGGGFSVDGGGPADDPGPISPSPPVGAECVVMFVGTGIDLPWVVAWSSVVA